MKLALLGSTPETIALLPLLSEAGLVVVEQFDAPGNSDSQLPVPQRNDWETLLHAATVDAVLVAGPLFRDEVPSELWARREEQLRKLVQAGVPLLVVPPVCEAIVGFELDMIRRDAAGLLFTLAPAAPSPFAAREATSLATDDKALVQEPWGIEYGWPNRSRRAVLSALLFDLHALVAVIGPLRRVAATGSIPAAGTAAEFHSLSVLFTGTSGAVARWSVGPAGAALETRWMQPGAGLAQRFVIDQAALQSQWRQTISQARSALRGEATTQTDWLEACRLVEVLEAVERSLARGRTIELYREEISEASSFKGTMAVWGCLLLLLGLAAFLAAGFVAWVFGLNSAGPTGSWLSWQICLLLPFALFLLLQLLSFGIPAHEQRKREKLGSSRAVEPPPPQENEGA